MSGRSPWSRAETVAGFAQSPPNANLMAYAADELERLDRARAIDLGCGAGRNAVPLARIGWDVLGIDLSMPMLAAAARRRTNEALRGRLDLACAAMESVPARGGSADLVIAHGIWNLARSASEFRRSVAEAARLSRPGAALFVFTFSRRTLPASAQPLDHEPFVFTAFSGEPQCFLTESQLVGELDALGFTLDGRVPLRELNLPQPGVLPTAGVPVIYEAAFRYRK